jgi:glucokinase
MKIIGIDIGGSSIKIGLIKNKRIIKKYYIPTNKKTLLDDIIKSFDDNKINLKNINSIGCAIPGFINHKKGIITLSGNLD